MNLLFDFDGTLFQTALCAIEAVHHCADILGIPHRSDEEIKLKIGLKSDVFLKEILAVDVVTEELLQQFRSYEREIVRTRGILFPDVIRMLEELRAEGHNLYICSNGSVSYLELALSSTGIRKYFTSIYSAREYDSKIAMVAEVKAILGENSVIIGDTDSDMNAGMENALPTIAADYGYGSEESLKTATFHAKSPMDIVSCVKQCEICRSS